MTSEGRPYLRHWGVLITDLTVIDTKVLIQTPRSPAPNRTVLGTMYELQRGDDDRNDVFVHNEFSVETIRSSWGSFDAQYVGTTVEISRTFDMVTRMTNGVGHGVANDK